MIALYIALSILAGCLLFLAGFYTGVWVQRHSREIIEREVPKVVETQRVVEVKVPELIQVPSLQQPKQGASLAVIGTNHRRPLSTTEEAESKRIGELVGQLPEVG